MAYEMTPEDKVLYDAIARIGVLGAIQAGLMKAGDGGEPAPAPTVDTLEGAGATGKAVMKAADAATARTAIGAGTSNLAIGTSASTAKAGNWKPAWADVTGGDAAVSAGVKAKVNSVAAVAEDAELAAVTAKLNELLAALKA
ncbi:tail fiber protein [Pseudomonas phage vB_PaeM_VL12]|uniref:Capsid and scaffold protein n=4 Tax=Nankokuvirus TaxID=1925779 RepID=V5JXI2_9CAUD|nr:hypothetical protein [Pseudomonas aeruginosa]YP_004306749.1 head fiber protein [Pseudomonas phage KPP10]YP_008857040.1 head fiber protein [Pseudomonas phage PAK_P5]YP_008858189.1 head fiber protein [Pseudomonas phage CHA_P1]QIQ65015.1 capsid and scaffold protein [Pseudomonas phage Epa16]QIQ65172.1 capsid and scaffold protein [Pseudomonas phage Epa18]UKM53971.1 tail fiber protein [Pseudomonas phage vB_PaeM_VL12]AGR89120.1 hypothetical protein CHA_P10166 [Pseudomonas phage CHA_P1]AGR89634.